MQIFSQIKSAVIYHERRGSERVRGSIGAVFGVLALGPLFALRECIRVSGGVSDFNVFGVTSLIFWLVVVVVTVKYVLFIMRTDNHGEGGVLALALLASHGTGARTRWVLLMIGALAAAMLFGNAMITPAISVMSAVEGIAQVDARFSVAALPAALALITLLFGLRERGIDFSRRLSDPIILVWLLSLGILGLIQIAAQPRILAAISPLHFLVFVARSPAVALGTSGAVFLAVAGSGALHAGIGRFGRRNVSVAWLLVALSCIMANYFGQAAFLLTHRSAASGPFFAMAPAWSLGSLVLLAVATAMSVSLTVILGMFRLAAQGIQLGLFPRMRILHISEYEMHEVLVPSVKGALYVSAVVLLLLFRGSARLSSAYGVALSLTMSLTTLLMYFVARHRWKWGRCHTLAVIVPLSAIDLLFLLGNLSKLVSGGGLPVLAGIVLFIVATTWHRGREYLVWKARNDDVPIRAFVDLLCSGSHSPLRVSGTAVFPGGVADVTPPAFIHNLKHNRVMHETNIFLSSTMHHLPYIRDDQRFNIEPLGHGCYAVEISLGFMEVPQIPRLLAALEQYMPGWQYDVADTSFFLARNSIVTSARGAAMPPWRVWLFAFLGRNAAHAAEYYSLPAGRVVELGGKISL